MDNDNMVCPNPVAAFFDFDETLLETVQFYLRCKRNCTGCNNLFWLGLEEISYNVSTFVAQPLGFLPHIL